MYMTQHFLVVNTEDLTPILLAIVFMNAKMAMAGRSYITYLHRAKM